MGSNEIESVVQSLRNRFLIGANTVPPTVVPHDKACDLFVLTYSELCFYSIVIRRIVLSSNTYHWNISFIMSLSGKVAIVTGGASGIGLATVKLFLESGAQVAVFDIQSSDELHGNERILFVKTNVASEESVNNAYNEVISKFGKLDVLVNNAGIMDKMQRTADVSNDLWNRIFAINVTGPMYLSRLAIKTFLSQETRGSIVNVASISGLGGSGAGVAYTMSKHALIGLSRSTAWGYSKDKIRTNLVIPGGVATPIMKDVTVDEAGKAVLLPFLECMPDYCQPSDLAAAILFAATSPALNGAEIKVDHGWTA